MVAFPIALEPDDNGTLLVTCALLPMVATYGADEAEARRRRHAADAIETALASMIADGETIPRPPDDRPGAVRLTARTALKLELYWALRDARVSRAELQRRLGWKRESVDRLLRIDHGSRLEQIEAAFAALGREIVVDVRAAA
ncbi:type II toxin-antitoxin system HicB family antitoxin [Methylobacterium sp. NEAU 140]|uniref:type II toxin-antitoxin system HicB family antitoxin n=1 Tax=Methylobacterium sp. NEAU 140 TaxID=3064945 RepID=UPI002733BEBB|nr:type II toxin-antitoxin system HicB family antitoxin [Methylobacterium sp. NEAU 140]MDP4025904.1 type II toxin-antitoxin system HicB family antitoxin [Methylobacterium sp. NEAU 140]